MVALEKKLKEYQIIWIHRLGTMDVFLKLHANPSCRCYFNGQVETGIEGKVIIKVSGIHPLETINVSTKFHRNPIVVEVLTNYAS